MFLKKLFIALSALCSASCVPNTHETAADTPTETNKQNSAQISQWNQDLSIDLQWDSSALGKKALKFAKAQTKASDVYPRFNLGNLAFIETISTTNANDYNGKSSFVGVILNDNMTIIDLPNEDLLKNVAAALRKSPEIVDQFTRIQVILALASGSPRHLSKSDSEWINDTIVDPTWNDENGVLSIEYYKAKTRGSAAPTAQKCVLTLDAQNNKSESCS